MIEVCSLRLKEDCTENGSKQRRNKRVKCPENAGASEG